MRGGGGVGEEEGCGGVVGLREDKRVIFRPRGPQKKTAAAASFSKNPSDVSDAFKRSCSLAGEHSSRD